METLAGNGLVTKRLRRILNKCKLKTHSLLVITSARYNQSVIDMATNVFTVIKVLSINMYDRQLKVDLNVK